MKNIIYYISITLIILIILYLSWILWLLEFIIFVVIYSLVFYWIYFLYKKIRKHKAENYKLFLINFIKKSSLSFIIIVILIWIFWYYQNYYSPATMIEYTISNWEKTVVFQEMSHIWSKNFYEKIKNNLINYKKQDFVYFFEWVKPGTKESMENFNKAIWIDFNKDLYKNFSKLYWVTFQDNSIYFNLVNNLDFNVDVWIDWIMEEYTTSPQPSPLKERENNVIDINSEILDTLTKLNDRQLSVLRFVNKAILSALIKSDSAQKLVTDNFWNKELFNIILDWRNKVLSDEIINSKYNKIYITYWKLHFDWVLKLLQENDKNWKIITKKEINSMN